MPPTGLPYARGFAPILSISSAYFKEGISRKQEHVARKRLRVEPISSATRTQPPREQPATHSIHNRVLSRLTQAESHVKVELAHSSSSSSAEASAHHLHHISPREDFEIVASEVYPAGSPPCPLPDAVLRLFPQHFSSVTSAKRACRRGEIWLDGAMAKTKSQKLVCGGQMLQWLQRVQGGERVHDACAPPGMHLVYEDADLACVVKPQGMPVAGKGGQLDLQTALPWVLSTAQGTGALWRPRFVHRLDQPTGGLIMIAKSRPALAALSAAFSHREVKKTYLAIVCGRLLGRGSVQFPLDGKPCLTEYQVLGHTRSAQHNWVTTVKLRPHTGRRHQLRRHLALIGHPLVNDRQYTYGFASQLLRSGRKAQRGRGDAQGDLPACSEEESAAEMYVPEEEACSDISDSSQDADGEANNSADIALGRFGREPASRQPGANPGAGRDPDELSAATALQRWEMDHSAGRAAGAGRKGRSEAEAVGGLSLKRPICPGTDDVDASLLCLWAVGLSLTHPRSGVLLNFQIEEPRLFDAVREREFQAWREL